MTETGDEVHPPVTHKAKSPGAVSIFFGKASIEHVKDIVKKRPTSFLRQYPEDETEDSPGSVGKKAAFFDQYIRRSSLEKVSDGIDGGKSANEIDFENGGEMMDSKTGAAYADNGSSIARSLDFSSAEKSFLEEATRKKSCAFVPFSNNLDIRKVDEEKALHQMGDLKSFTAVTGHDYAASSANSARVALFKASHDDNENEHNVNKNGADFQTANKVVQIEADTSNKLLPLRKECEPECKQKTHAVGIQLERCSDYKPAKIKPEDSAHMGNGKYISKKVPLQQKKTSIYPKKGQQSSLAVPNSSSTSLSANANGNNKDVRTTKANEAARVKQTAAPVNRSNTRPVVSHTISHGSLHTRGSLSRLYAPHQNSLTPEKSNSLTKGSIGQGPQKQIVTKGSNKISAASTGRDLEVASIVSKTTDIKASSQATNGKLIKIRAGQQTTGQGDNFKDIESAEKEKSETKNKELPQKLVSNKISSVRADVSNLGKPSTVDSSSDATAASLSRPKDEDPKKSNGHAKLSSIVRDKPGARVHVRPLSHNKKVDGKDLASKVSNKLPSNKTSIHGRAQAHERDSHSHAAQRVSTATIGSFSTAKEAGLKRAGSTEIKD